MRVSSCAWHCSIMWLIMCGRSSMSATSRWVTTSSRISWNRNRSTTGWRRAASIVRKKRRGSGRLFRMWHGRPYILRAQSFLSRSRRTKKQSRCRSRQGEPTSSRMRRGRSLRSWREMACPRSRRGTGLRRDRSL